jgi:hypothetical protein
VESRLDADHEIEAAVGKAQLGRIHDQEFRAWSNLAARTTKPATT